MPGRVATASGATRGLLPAGLADRGLVADVRGLDAGMAAGLAGRTDGMRDRMSDRAEAGDWAGVGRTRGRRARAHRAGRRKEQYHEGKHSDHGAAPSPLWRTAIGDL